MDKFKDLQLPDIPRQTVHIPWADIQSIAGELLKRLLKRTLLLDVERSDHYDWGISLINGTWLTTKELEQLFKVVDADDWDRESNDFGEDPIQSLSQSLSRKLFTLVLSFNAESSFADDGGVWFMGKHVAPQATVKPVFPDEMPTDKTLFCIICDSVDYERKVHEDEMQRKGVTELLLSNICKTSIMHEVSSFCCEDLGNCLNIENDLVKLKVIYSLTQQGVFLQAIADWSLGLDSVDISSYEAIEQLIRDFCATYLEEDAIKCKWYKESEANT